MKAVNIWKERRGTCPGKRWRSQREEARNTPGSDGLKSVGKCGLGEPEGADLHNWLNRIFHI